MRSWIVAFTDDGATDWWDLFTRKGYRHAFCASYDPTNKKWIVVDWKRQRMEVGILNSWQATTLIAYMMEKCICYEIDEKKHDGVGWIGLLRYCVPMIKEITGLRCRAVTPYQLACALKKAGARRIFDGTPKTENSHGKPERPEHPARSGARSAEGRSAT